MQLSACFAGTMMGITNTLASLPGFIGPAVVGVLTHKNVSVLYRCGAVESVWRK